MAHFTVKFNNGTSIISADSEAQVKAHVLTQIGYECERVSIVNIAESVTGDAATAPSRGRPRKSVLGNVTPPPALNGTDPDALQ